MSRNGMIKNLLNYGITEHYNMMDNKSNDRTEAEMLNDEMNVLLLMDDEELKELYVMTIDVEVIELLSC